MKQRYIQAFTLVELIVVIAVIGLLAAIVTMSYAGVQGRARATTIISGIKDVEDAFGNLATAQGATTWWRDTAFTGSGNPTIPAIIAATSTSNFYKYLQQVPTNVSGMTLTWNYDNDGDNRDPSTCDTSWSGVVLAVAGVPTDVSQQIDSSIDDGNSKCGRVRSNGTTLIYELSYTQTMQQ